MGTNEIYNTLSVISSYQDTLNTIGAKDMPIKKVCTISANSVKAWGVVINEFNDVITALEGESGIEDRVYRVAFMKALEIVFRAIKYKRGD